MKSIRSLLWYWAMGLLISTRTQSQFQAVQVGLFVFLPLILLSTFMFPFDGIPHAAQRLD